MVYQEFRPINVLQDYIQYFWVLEDHTDNSDRTFFRVIPDGVPALIYQEGPSLFYDHRSLALPQLYIYGQSSRYIENSVTGYFRIIGVYLHPTALKTIFNIDAFEFSNQNIPLADIVSDNILEQLMNASTTDEKIAIMSDFFLKRIQSVKFNDEKATFATTLLQKGASLKDIQAEMALSERSLERLVKQYVGMSPKMFSRITRFQSGLDILRKSGSHNLTTLAYAKAYFDQSHYIREFKEFTGTTPKIFLLRSDETLANFPKWNL
ncbi:MAG: helix-turn-helix domain-containing protein [Sphingobacterium sp.]|jgi:AraC-like DNA-binding protein|nr:helix-turn-helix domain-containing protein [Sphingobacterium sp.]